MEKIKIGFLGAGNIAHAMAATVAQMPEAELWAVAARDAKRAEIFAQQYGFSKAYGSYEELVQDENIQLVYISTPHSHHAQHALLCIEHGKPVLCEKAFTGNARQAEEVLNEAARRKVFVAEAIWPRYMPLARTLRELVQDGDAMGHVSSLQANFGFPLLHIERMTKANLAGGALLDLGVYPITFASIAFGPNVVKTTSDAVLTSEGVDAQNSITLRYCDGRLAQLASNMTAAMKCGGVLFGEQGYIEVDGLNNFTRIEVFDTEGNSKALYTPPTQISGYEYEVAACILALREGRLECPEMPHSETLRIMRLMDSLRAEWGVVYPFD